jgi:cytochrome c-type biogenesis protein CcmH
VRRAGADLAHEKIMKRHIEITLIGALLLAAFLAQPVAAQTPTPNEINEIAKDLWCPLCNGVRLDNCELQACVQMREVISEKLIAGASKEEIKAYFVTQYGDVVLGAPSGGGFSLVVWLLPVLAAIIGLGWLIYFVTTNRKRAPVPATTDAANARPAAEDEYLHRVEEELRKQD